MSIPDEFIRLQTQHEAGVSDLSAQEIDELAAHTHPGVRGLLLCMHRDGEINIPAALIDRLIKSEEDDLNRIILDTILQKSKSQIDNVFFPKFGS